MPIIDIEHGSLASSKLLNDNFHSLHSDMQQLLTTLESKVATLQSQLESKINTVTSSTKNEVLEKIFPIGCLHFSLGGAPAYGQWVQVAQDRVIQGSGSLWGAGATPAQGLPNHTHNLINSDISNNPAYGGGYLSIRSDFSGGDYKYHLCSSGTYPVLCTTGYATDSNATYSEPNGRVQPYAYVVNVWQRVA